VAVLALRHHDPGQLLAQARQALTHPAQARDDVAHVIQAREVRPGRGQVGQLAHGLRRLACDFARHGGARRFAGQVTS
jgi:hypothetical protein